MKKYPLFFFGHGSPMNAILDTEFSRTWTEIGKTLEKPKAILSISAHFETYKTHITATNKPKTMYDFFWFPDELYKIKYEMQGSEKIAKQIISQLNDENIFLDYSWWIDHGVWSILKFLFPDIWEIPVLELSLDITKSPQQHFEFAKKLLYLREKWYLILGSWNIIHNLYKMDWSDENASFDWAKEVNESVKNMILLWATETLLNFGKMWPKFEMAIPTREHFLPLLYIYALKWEHETIEFFNDRIVNGSLSMTSFKIS